MTSRKRAPHFTRLILALLICHSLSLVAAGQPPVVLQAPAPAAPRSVAPTSQFNPDFGEPLWQSTMQMPAGSVSNDSDRQPGPKLDVKISTINAAMVRTNTIPTVAANPGKNFQVAIYVDYQASEPTKLFANLKLDTLLAEEEKQKLMRFHASTWHFDTESSPRAQAVTGPGSQFISLIGTAPKEEGEYEFDIDVGLMPKQSGGILKRLYRVKLVTKFVKPEPLQPSAVAMHSLTKRMAVGGRNGKVRLLNATDGQIVQTWSVGNSPVVSLAFSEPGDHLAVGFGPGQKDDQSIQPIRVCGTLDGTVLSTLEKHSDSVTALAYVGNKQLVSCGRDGQILLWDTATGKQLASYKSEGSTSGLSFCVASNTICAVVGGATRIDWQTETRQKTIAVCSYATETRTRTVQACRIEKNEINRQIPVDFEGLVRQILQKKVTERTVPYTVEVPYTVSYPVTTYQTMDYTVTLPMLINELVSSTLTNSVIQLSLPDLKPIGRWTPEGERLPVGTSFNQDGSRIFVTTQAGISVLESKSMIELVDLREKGPTGQDRTEAIHHLSPFYLPDRDAVLTPGISQLVTLRSKPITDNDYFQSLAQSAQSFKARSMERARTASKVQFQSPPPPPVSPSEPPAPKLPTKPLLANVEPDKNEVLINRYNYDILGLEEPQAAAPKVYQVDGIDHHDVIVADAPHRTTIAIPSGFASFTTFFGLQDKHDGSVAFVVRGDGRPLYRSSIIRDHILHGITLDVRGLKELELVVEETDKGKANDQALWIDPTLSRTAAPDAYEMTYVEIQLTGKSLDPSTLVLQQDSFEAFGNFDGFDSEFRIDGVAWKPQSQATLKSPWNGKRLDFSRARIHVNQCDRGILSYLYQSENVIFQFKPHDNSRMDCAAIVQVPLVNESTLPTVDSQPLWSAPWKVAGWKPQKEYLWNELPPLPGKGQKNFAVSTPSVIDWAWHGDFNSPLENCPETHSVLIGERKFQSDGGIYRIETLSDDGLHIKLDGETVIENWQHNSIRQHCRLIALEPGLHTLRFEYADSIGEKRLCVGLRKVESRSKSKDSSASPAGATVDSVQIGALKVLRELNSYLQFDFAAPKVSDKLFLHRVSSQNDSALLGALAVLPLPRTIQLGQSSISPEVWRSAVDQANLKYAMLIYPAERNDFMNRLGSIKSLRKLLVSGDNPTSKVVSDFTQNSSIKEATFWYSGWFDDAALSRFGKMQSLKRLGVFQTKCTLDGVRDCCLANAELRCDHDIRSDSKPVEFFGKQIVVVTKPMPFLNADAYARAIGGNLVVPASEQENNALTGIASQFGIHNAMWLGMSDSKEEGTWLKTNGQPNTFTNWAPGEPNGKSLENFASLLIRNRYWNDTNATLSLPFAVELSDDPVQRDPDRRAAQRVLDMEGSVYVVQDGKRLNIKFGDKLPEQPFRVQDIAISNHSHNPGKGASLVDEDLAIVKELEDLRFILLAGTNITDESLDYLKGKNKVESLDLQGTKVSEQGLVRLLDSLPKVRSLTIARISVGDLAMQTIAKLPLNNLIASETEIGDAGVAHLNGKIIPRVFLDGTKVTNASLPILRDTVTDTLSLANTKITSDGLASLAGMSIRILSLYGTDIDDKGIESLKHLKQIEQLQIQRTKVTDAGVQSFLETFPQCKVVR